MAARKSNSDGIHTEQKLYETIEANNEKFKTYKMNDMLRFIANRFTSISLEQWKKYRIELSISEVKNYFSIELLLSIKSFTFCTTITFLLNLKVSLENFVGSLLYLYHLYSLCFGKWSILHIVLGPAK